MPACGGGYVRVRYPSVGGASALVSDACCEIEDVAVHYCGVELVAVDAVGAGSIGAGY